MTEIAESIVATMRHPVLGLDLNLNVTLVNPAFCKLFQVSGEECVGRKFAALGNGQWNIPELLDLLGEVRDTRAKITDFRIEHDFERIGRRIMLLNAGYLKNSRREVLLAIEDVTERERYLFELEAKKEFAEKVVDASRDALLILGWDLRVRSANETFYRIFQVDPSATEGRLVYELGDGQWNIPRLRELLEQVLPEQQSFDDFEVEHDFPGIGRKSMLLNARRIDHMRLILLAIEDITARRRSMEALRASEERLRRVLETEAVGVLFFDAESGTLIDANDAFLKMTGYSREDVDKRRLSWRSMTPREWVPVSEEQLEKLHETGRIGPYEKEYRRQDGSRAWMLFIGRGLDDGTVAEYCIDVTDRKLAEHERELLARELSHRVKNTLAVVQALADMTNGQIETVAAYREKFLGRLQALARAQSLLLDDNWSGAQLKALVEQTTMAFKLDNPEMIVFDGEDVSLTAKQAMGLSLVLHELGTNAVKHGALSVHGGQLTLSWKTERAADGRRIRLIWRERGGPHVEAPTRHGFGMEMIEQTASYELDGETRLDFTPEGLTCEIIFPVE